MKYKIATWNCKMKLEDMVNAIYNEKKKNVDILVVQEYCEPQNDVFIVKNKHNQEEHMYKLLEWIGRPKKEFPNLNRRQTGIAVFYNSGTVGSDIEFVQLEPYTLNGLEIQKYYQYTFLNFKLKNRNFTGVWTTNNRNKAMFLTATGQLKFYLSSKKFSREHVFLGDFNIEMGKFLEKEFDALGLTSENKNSIPTYYHHNKNKTKTIIDHVFGNEDIKEFSVLKKHPKSDHCCLYFEIDL